MFRASSALRPNGDIFVAESRAGRVPCRFRERPSSSTLRRRAQQPVRHRLLSAGTGPATTSMSAKPDASVPLSPAMRAARGRNRRGRTSAGTGGHWTRDIAFSPDGSGMFVSVGSGCNVGEGTCRAGMRRRDCVVGSTARARAPPGATRGTRRRARLRSRGSHRRVFATGSATARRWRCSPQPARSGASSTSATGLATTCRPTMRRRLREGAFYGWPWYYIGDHEDPRHKGERPDLAGKVTVPDVLIQPHSAPLRDRLLRWRRMFPAEYRGDAFVALHGSWNRGIAHRLQGRADRARNGRLRGFPDRLCRR